MSYIVWNGAAPTTAAMVSTALANGIKTHLQLATPSDMPIQLVQWGYTMDIAPAAGIVSVELLQTDVAATMTSAHISSGIINYDPNGPSSRLTLGASATGYNGNGTEGSITATRVFDAQKIPVAAGSTDLNYDWLWPYRAGPIIPVSKFLRVRTTALATTPTIFTYIVFDQL
jgi:hypothetical protein